MPDPYVLRPLLGEIFSLILSHPVARTTIATVQHQDIHESSDRSDTSERREKYGNKEKQREGKKEGKKDGRKEGRKVE